MWRDAQRMAVREEAPGPWPSRVEAFLTACAMHAGQREADLLELVRGVGGGIEDAVRNQR